MQFTHEIVVHTTVSDESLATLPEVLQATLDVWSRAGVIGDVARWDVFECNFETLDGGL